MVFIESDAKTSACITRGEMNRLLIVGTIVVLIVATLEKKMKYHHFMTIVLAGWYVIIPPRNGTTVHEHAAFSEWHIAGSYDTSDECQSQLQSAVLDARAELPSLDPKSEAHALAYSFKDAICIS